MSINKYFLEFKNIFSFKNKNGITIHKIINNEDDEATIVYAIDKPIENLRYRRFKGFWYNSSIKYTNEDGKTIKAEAIFLEKCAPEVLELFENILKIIYIKILVRLSEK
ncbi:hypothetical protein ASO20_00095 [Mycoplasma sp. (ex Biomphalaria glabrata)]|uniref:hypothetical protein n=1 Tax=Mycoplasma sp. (ex Biomphalaria glabrata) TaxID=1749074 RepID=UPI00073AE021|nr:hypothetical protein [Mycoplasma sp. (ex Biomphalaria glabrata)]ALV23081.1 hypothetical protein ASO20_00095 [Mycoplasma sp. (ex Biomphalaria glabrata)]